MFAKSSSKSNKESVLNNKKVVLVAAPVIVPPIVRKATCILEPANTSKKLNILHLSSKHHKRGDIHPISKSMQEIHNKPLKILVTSNKLILSADT